MSSEQSRYVGVADGSGEIDWRSLRTIIIIIIIIIIIM